LVQVDVEVVTRRSRPVVVDPELDDPGTDVVRCRVQRVERVRLLASLVWEVRRSSRQPHPRAGGGVPRADEDVVSGVTLIVPLERDRDLPGRAQIPTAAERPVVVETGIGCGNLVEDEFHAIVRVHVPEGARLDRALRDVHRVRVIPGDRRGARARRGGGARGRRRRG